jgi:predicted Rossmann fold nucleotide-binding protein DprA/Smf involved in DNA uptake
MQRNKLIYALADTSLVVSSDLNKGGTWAGAIEQLDKLKFVPVFVRSTGELSAGLESLRKKGALPWPNPQDVDSFAEVFNLQIPSASASPKGGFSLFEGSPAADTTVTTPVPTFAAPVPKTESEPSAPVDVVSDPPPSAAMPEEPRPATSEAVLPADGAKGSPQPELTPAEMLFSAARAAIQQLLIVPMQDAEVAAALNVSNAQAKAWLQRLVDEGLIEKRSKPIRYAQREHDLFSRE